MTVAYIALGSNLDNPLQQVTTAVSELADRSDCDVIACSPWYQTAPVGPGEQSDYINGVLAVRTQLAPESLLNVLQTIEDSHHRQRLEHWGPRTLDLDILLYGQQSICTPRLEVPHPRITERNFVIYPLAALSPNLIMPNGISIASLLENTSSAGIVRLTVGEICGSTG